MATVKQIGSIRIFAEIYQGATTLVYKGYQPSLDRVVLLKVLRPEFSQDKTLSQRFEEEAKLIAKIQHPNVVAIYDYGRQENLIYLAAEFIEGFNLLNLIRKNTIPPELAWFILLETTKGLKAAHDKNILHKDIKPSNILVSHDGQVKITDFGMATLRESSQGENVEEVRGTLAYFSPEQILGENFNQNSDIFSLGATFYEMLTGNPAFSGKKAGDYFNAILNQDPCRIFMKRGDLPQELSSICRKMLMKDPVQRYHNCDELLKDLEAFQINSNITIGATQLKTFLQNPNSYLLKYPPVIIPEAKVDKRFRYKRSLFIFLSFTLIFILGYLGFKNIKSKESLRQEKVENSQKIYNQELESSGAQELNETFNNKKSLEDPAISSIKERNKRETTQNKKILRAEESKLEPDNLVLEEFLEKSAKSKTFEVGYLQINCIPWAIVYLDGDSIGTTPLEDSLKLKVGTHEIFLKNPDFPDYKTSIEIRNNTKTNYEISLWSFVGTLNLEISPWAEVFIDGEYKDTVPPQQHPIILLPGNHSLILKHPVLGEWKMPIEIKAGESLVLKFNLINLLSQEMER